MRQLTLDELELVSGGGWDSGDDIYSGGWLSSAWSWFSDFFSGGGSSSDGGKPISLSYSGSFDTSGSAISGGQPATVDVNVQATVQPIDIHVSIDIFGYDIPILDLNVSGE